MILYQIFYRIAFIVTGFLHLYFNDLIKAALMAAMMCLSDSKRPIVQSILRLHSVVLAAFMLAFCFNTASAYPSQTTLAENRDVLNASFMNWLSKITADPEQFDDIETRNGFADVPTGYHGLTFNDLFAFQPTHPNLEKTISLNDLNCAVSKPNALYGSKVNKESPSIQAHDPSRKFTVHSLKIKPLDLPVGFVTINLRAFPSNSSEDTLIWNVDFPAGFHDVLVVRIEEFSKARWAGLTKLEMWATFYFNNVEMDDWEFCVDDLDIEVEPSS
jgi:hypothetical protein